MAVSADRVLRIYHAEMRRAREPRLDPYDDFLSSRPDCRFALRVGRIGPETVPAILAAINAKGVRNEYLLTALQTVDRIHATSHYAELVLSDEVDQDVRTFALYDPPQPAPLDGYDRGFNCWRILAKNLIAIADDPTMPSPKRKLANNRLVVVFALMSDCVELPRVEKAWLHLVTERRKCSVRIKTFRIPAGDIVRLYRFRNRERSQGRSSCPEMVMAGFLCLIGELGARAAPGVIEALESDDVHAPVLLQSLIHVDRDHKSAWYPRALALTGPRARCWDEAMRIGAWRASDKLPDQLAKLTQDATLTRKQRENAALARRTIIDLRKDAEEEKAKGK